MKHVQVIFMTTISVFLLAAVVLAEIPLSQYAIWQRNANGIYPTGVGWGDINGDGWLDLVVSNGIDVVDAPTQVFFSVEGTIQTTPGWVSQNQWEAGNLCLGDFNNDGGMDVVIAALAEPDHEQPHCAFYNTGDGFPSLPDWSSPPANAFSNAIGDPDGDGDIDVVFGQGFRAIDPAECRPQPLAIFFNNDGMFEDEPSWVSDSLYLTIDVAFVDIDMDGDHDLVATMRENGIQVFYNDNGVIETSPSWVTRSINGGRQLSFGDFDGDGYPDLAVACQVQDFYLFMNNAGTLAEEPCWHSNYYNEPACVYWADVDYDGDLDLGAGSWFSRFGVFENVDGTLDQSYTWQYSNNTWTEQMAWADYDEDGLIDTTASYLSLGLRKLFYLGVQPVHEISSVDLDGVPLELSEFCYDLQEGWISLANTPPEGTTLTINYTKSRDLDLAVTSTTNVRIFENISEPPPVEANILVILGDQVGANYNFTQAETRPNIRDYFEGWGWNITETAVTERVDSCHVYGALFGCSSIEVDTLIWDIENINYYDIITIIPGSGGHTGLIASEDALNLIQDAANTGEVVSAWCRGVRVLAAADLIDGLDVVGHADYADEYESAGANYLGDNHPPVTEGNIVTGVRSRYYRAEMVQAMYDAVVAALSVEDPGIDTPVEYSLSQCYPNPFNGATTIQFTLPDPGHVRLSVYDILGREVMQLVDQPLSIGVHSYQVNAESLASGVYFYQLTTGNISEVRKMLLLR